MLNVDGNSMDNPGQAGFEGLLRMHDGEWLVGFYGSIGYLENLQAELAAIFFGLSMAWDQGMRKLVCYSDSKLVIELSLKSMNDNHAHGALISAIKDLLHRDWEVQLSYTLREGNESANLLAKTRALQQEQLWILPRPPAAIGASLLADAMRTPLLRR